MKRLIVIIGVLLVTLNPVYATEYEISGNDKSETFESEDYLPEIIKSILKENGADIRDKTNINTLTKSLIDFIKNGLDKHGNTIFSLISIIVFISVINKIIDNEKLKMIFGYISILLISLNVFGLLSDAVKICTAYLSSLYELLSALLPTFITVSILGDAPITSVTASTSFASVLSFLEIFLSGIVQVMATLLVVFSVFERVSPILVDFNLSKTVKKYTLMLLSFITTVMVTVLGYQGIISARADSLSTRTVKFAAANFIPIIGNAVGDALKSVSSGVLYLRSSIGGASALALFFCVFPVICEVVIIKISVSFISFLSGILGSQSESAYISSVSQVFDIILSIIICSFILSFLLIYLFSFMAIG